MGSPPVGRDDSLGDVFIPLSLIEHSPTASLAVDSAGTVRYSNPAASALFGHATELKGANIESLIASRPDASLEGGWQALLDDALSHPLLFRSDLSGRRMDGTSFPAELSLARIPTNLGDIVFIGVVDVSERQEIVRQLDVSERRFQTVLEANPNSVISVDEHGRVVYANPAVEETFGYSLDEVLGQPVDMLVPDALRERHAAHRAGYMRDPQMRSMGIGLDLTARRKDGSEFPAEIGLSPLVTPNGVEVFVRIVDVTLRKRAENELLQAQKLESVGRLAGGIAHDFNNLLFAIGGYAELLEQDLSVSGQLDRGAELETVGAIRQAVDRAQELTSQLLSFSRQQVISPRALSLNDALDRVAPLLRRLIGENVKLVVSPDEENAHIRADPGQLDQILINLAVNARDAMPEGGTLTIASGQSRIESGTTSHHEEMEPGAYVTLTVSDTGVGMDRDTQQHIFEPFFTTKERGQGTGLGLATTYGIVRQSGGYIWVYSEPGAGSVFKLYFPRVDGGEPGAVDEAPTTAPALSASGSVLVVEDDAAVRKMTARMLERAGYRVISAANGQAALEILAGTEKFAAVVTDVIMPGLSGIELAEKTLDARPGIGVVLLSGYTEDSFDLARLRERHVAFVAKPTASTELLTAVAEVIARSGFGEDQ